MAIALFAAQHLPLKNPSVQWGSPQDTSSRAFSLKIGWQCTEDNPGDPCPSQAAWWHCWADPLWPLAPKLGPEALSQVQCCCCLEEAQPQSNCHSLFSCRMSTD